MYRTTREARRDEGAWQVKLSLLISALFSKSIVLAFQPHADALMPCGSAPHLKRLAPRAADKIQRAGLANPKSYRRPVSPPRSAAPRCCANEQRGKGRSDVVVCLFLAINSPGHPHGKSLHHVPSLTTVSGGSSSVVLTRQQLLSSNSHSSTPKPQDLGSWL